LASQARTAPLSTIAREPEGFPFGSLVAIATDGYGRPLLLLSTLAEHTRNLAARSDASILVTESSASEQEPLALGRVTILGACAEVARDEVESVRAIFLEQQPRSSTYASFADFSFYRLEPASLRYVGGFGRMSWVTAADYRLAEPDPLAGAAASILRHMNGDHGDAVLAYAATLVGVKGATSATMTSVDRYGFDLAVVTDFGPRAVRLGFDEPLSSSDDVRRALIALAKRARS
jgi:putative heme iron utilization protein